MEPCRLVESVVLVKILCDVEREFYGEVVGVLPEGLVGCFHHLRRYSSDLVLADVPSGAAKDYLDPEWEPPMRLDVVAVPGTLNDMLALFLRRLVYKYEIGVPAPHVRRGALEGLVPMYRVPRGEVLAYALLTGILANLDCHVETAEGDVVDRFVAQLSVEHPELLYRFLSSAVPSRWPHQ